MLQSNRYSVYDHMERKGAFASNPANRDARAKDGTLLFKGPLKYPKMLYHPEGEEKVLVPATVEIDRGREIHIPAKLELISQIVQDEEEEKAFKAEGWHDHPAKAIERLNLRLKREGLKLKPVPSMSLDRVAEDLADANVELLDENAQLRAELAQLKAKAK